MTALLTLFEGIRADLRFGFFQSKNKRAWFLYVVLTLGLGFGVCFVALQIINAVLFGSLPWNESDRIVEIYNRYPGAGVERASSNVANFVERSGKVDALLDLGLIMVNDEVLRYEKDSETVRAAKVTASLFNVFSLRTRVGHFFPRDSEKSSDRFVVVVSDHLGRRLFGASQDPIGKRIFLGGVSFEIVGVLAPTLFPKGLNADIWIPMTFNEAALNPDSRHENYARMFGKLKTGSTAEIAEHQIQALNTALYGVAKFDAFAYKTGQFSTSVISVKKDLIHHSWLLVLILASAALLIFLQCCANVAIMVVDQITERRREFRIRMAVGASVGRIARQILTECISLAWIGGGAGLVFAFFILSGFYRSGFSDVLPNHTVELSAPVILCGLVLLNTGGILFGAIALFVLFRQKALGGVSSLRDLSRDYSVFNVLAVFQNGLGLNAVFGALVLMFSLIKLYQVNVGYSAQGVLTARLLLTQFVSEDPKRRVDTVDNILRSVQSEAGVKTATVSQSVPFSGVTNKLPVFVEGMRDSSGVLPSANVNYVDERYFDTMQIPLLLGRLFAAKDAESQKNVAVIERSFAERYFPEGAVGRRLAFGDSTTARTDKDFYSIVGVVADTRYEELGQTNPLGTVYLSFRQDPPSSCFLALRGESPQQGGLVTSLRAALKPFGGVAALFDVRTMDERIENSMASRSLSTRFAEATAALSLIISFCSLYGILAIYVTGRKSDLAIRLAIGATYQDLRAILLRRTLWIGGVGVLLGIGLTALTHHLLKPLQYGNAPWLAGTMGLSLVLYIVVLILATGMASLRLHNIHPRDVVAIG